MLDSNLLKILRTFSDSEWKEFEKFCESPFHNYGRSYKKFLLLLRKHRPDFSDHSLKRETMYASLYPGKDYKPSVIESEISRLGSLAEEFLLQLELRENPFHIKERLVVRQLGKRGLKNRADKYIRKTEAELEAELPLPFGYTALREASMEFVTFYSISNQREIVLDRIQKTIETLFYSFVSELAYFATAERSVLHRKVEEVDYSYGNRLIHFIDLEGLMKTIHQNDSKNFKWLNLYHLMYKAVSGKLETDKYFQFKKACYEIFDEMDKKMRRFVLNVLGVLSNVYLVSGATGFKKESFEIKRKTLDSGLYAFSESGVPKVREFRSTFIDAMNANEYRWAEEFCEKYLDTMPYGEREGLRNYCMARLAYERRDFDRALESALKVELKQTIFKLDMKNLMAKIYYDTESLQSLHYLLDTYSKMTARQEDLSFALKQRHKKFQKYMKNLLRLVEGKADGASVASLRDCILRDNFTSRSWILDRVEKLLLKV